MQVCNITVKIEVVKYKIFNIILKLGNKGFEDIGEITNNEFCLEKCMSKKNAF